MGRLCTGKPTGWESELLVRDCGGNLVAARPEHQLCGAFARVEEAEGPARWMRDGGAHGGEREDDLRARP